MFLSSNNKSIFFEDNEYTWLIARTSASVAPLVVEDIKEIPKGDKDALASAIKQLQPKKASSGYLRASCSFYPPRRVLRRVTLETKRLKEANQMAYLAEVCSQQLRIDTDKHTLATLNPADGLDFDSTKGGGKDVLVCGLPSEDIIVAQNSFLELGVYPERVELGSVALLGLMVDYIQFAKCKAPTLVLELGEDATQSYILGPTGVEATRPIPQGIAGMVPVVQKELGLKDEESARKLFYSNTFDFGGMGALLIKRLVKELQSSIGFYEVQTGQSIGQVVCLLLPPKLTWLESAIASSLGVGLLQVDIPGWAQSRKISFSSKLLETIDARWLGLLAAMTRYNPDTGNATAEKKD